MSKNLCPVNDLTFENSQQIKFDDASLAAGAYTVSAIYYAALASALNYWMNEWVKTL